MPRRNEGEGSRSAARRYNKGAAKVARKGRQENPAPRSEEERRELEQAEEEGRSRAKELDPAVDRDYEKPVR